MRKTAAAFLFLLVLVTELAFAQALIKDTKHNLSSSGPGTIKAASETQICVFCHTPHNANISLVAPLWNKTLSTATYTLYTSDYLTGLGYPTAVLGSSTKLCLSCHDGTVALGSVYNLPGPAGAGTIQIQQSGANITTLPAGATNLGINLSDDHPVGHLYEPARNAELVSATTRPFPWPKGVQLDPNLETGRVECKSCHDPHNNQIAKFLHRQITDGTLSTYLCTYCHTKTGYVVSSHATSTQAYTPIGGTLTDVGKYSCRSCHKTHTAAGSRPLLQRLEQLSCYDAGCHGSNNPNATNATSDTYARRMLIQPEMAKASRHPTNDNVSPVVHRNRPFSTTTGAEPPAELGDTNRHAECQDCHNPHQVQKAAAAEKSTRGALRISLTLKGTWGVEPVWPTPETGMTNNLVTNPIPSSFTPVGVTPTGVSSNPALTNEYQVCMKCHSNYVTLPSGKTNIARQINPANSSYHGMVPLVTVGTIVPRTNYFVNTTTTFQPWGGATATSPAFVANTGTLASPSVDSTEWNRQNPGSVAAATAADYANRGRVWCSDCHGSDTSTMPPVSGTKAAPYGPHGSTLTGTGAGTSNSDRMLVRSIASAVDVYTPLCLVCHRPGSYSTGKTGTRMTSHAGRGSYATSGCFTCHMWEAANVVTGASGRIFAHGMNKRWATIGKSTTAGSLQMVDAFVGGSSQTNINYATKKCWTAASIGASADGSGTVTCGRTDQSY